MTTIGSNWSLVPKNGWNKVEQGWNLDCFDAVKHGWKSLEGTRNEWLDLFLSLLGPQTRSQGVLLGHF